jgi:hypothetical protein
VPDWAGKGWYVQAVLTRFSSADYVAEMRKLVNAAVVAWRSPSAGIRPPIFTVSIWTDPEAGRSAVNIDTRENSEMRVRHVNDYNCKQRAELAAEGDAEMAALFEVVATRNCNPADFVHPELACCEHSSLPANWGSGSSGDAGMSSGPRCATSRSGRAVGSRRWHSKRTPRSE